MRVRPHLCRAGHAVDPGSLLLLPGMLLCNDTELEQATEEDDATVGSMIGDPHEGG